jgi:hypothetical protein
MDRNHSRLIIILLAGILFVLLLGREPAIEALGSVSWIMLVIGTVVAIIWMIIAAIRYVRREAIVYSEEVRRDRDEGRPWLHTFILWPAAIGNFAVVGFAAFRYFDHECRRFTGDCLEQIPLWWVPVLLLLLSMIVEWLEKLFLRRQQPRH